jgi:enoyl-CoA hydratase/carnithine racemase
MPLSGPEILLYEKRDHIVTITMNRPERMNALSLELFDRLDEAWEKFQHDDDAFVAIWTAAGDRAFCVGMDLKDQAERVAKDPSFDIVRLKPGVLDGSVGTPYGHNVTKPVIAAINGIATAGGFQFVMMSDLRVAAEHATFGVGEVKVGRGTPWAVPLLWQMPLPMAFEILLMGNPVPAKRLYEVGWINRVVPLDKLMSTAWEMATVLAENAPLSVRAAKEALYKAMDVGRHAGLEMAKLIYQKVYASEDAIEGPKAFAEKRKPVWKGR